MTQIYAGRVQILFGVHLPDDPVCELVRELILKHPQVDAELVVCPKILGPNAKVSTLIQLQRLAKYEVIAISDADVRVPGDFLAQAALPLENKNAGLVNCFYRLAHTGGFAMRCEALMVNGDFWTQVLQSRSVKPLHFALGAAMVTTQSRLREIGAFDSLVEYLADDYQLGNRIAKTGAEVVISPIVVESWSSLMTAREVWQHQLRWARTMRVCEPGPYFLSILNDLTFWTFSWMVAGPPNLSRIVPVVAACAIARCVMVLTVETKLTRWLDVTAVPASLFYDLIRPVLWALSFLGSTVVWRGRKFRVVRGGKLTPLNN
jgi:ceramide glucosyltransferase